MNIRKSFNRLAAGLGLGLAVAGAGPARAQPPMPPDSTPDYMPRIYERIINASGGGDRTRSYIHSSITRLAATPASDWLKSLRNMSPADAQEEIRSCFQSLCEHKYPLLTENEKFIARVIVIEAMFHEGLTEEEFRTYSEFVSRFQPDHSFQQRDEALIDAIADKIIGSPEYANLKQRIVPAAHITAANASEQFGIRKNFIDLVTHEIRSAYNMDAVTTHLDNFPQRLSGAAAYALNRGNHPYLPTKNTLLFNYAVPNAHAVESLLDVAAHETRHTMDFDNRDRAHRYEINADEPEFRHVAVINLNQNLYIPLCSGVTHPSITCPQQFDWYKNQYAERSAQDFARKLVEKFRDKARIAEALENTPQSASSLEGVHRLEAEKLKLPS